MASQVTEINRALALVGTRTNVTQAELDAQSTNEAIQATLIYDEFRDRLLRMAQWDCASQAINLNYVTSIPGTPENQSISPTQQWQPGLPQPPWAYEYQYPVNCLRALWILPQFQTGLGGVPMTTAVSGYTPAASGPPIRFNVATDYFYSVASATVINGGTGYNVGDLITLAGQPTPTNPTTSPPIGAPAVLQVLTVSGGAVATVAVINSVAGEATTYGGSYFAQQPNPQAQGTTTGSGSGATFDLTWNAPDDQRVIVTNQESATLFMVKQVTDENVWDPLFRSAFENVLAAGLAIVLTGDKPLANLKIQAANSMIAEARAVDGNEGLTINDVTPDFIRVRGVIYSDYWYEGQGTAFDWGGFWPGY